MRSLLDIGGDADRLALSAAAVLHPLQIMSGPTWFMGLAGSVRLSAYDRLITHFARPVALSSQEAYTPQGDVPH